MFMATTRRKTRYRVPNFRQEKKTWNVFFPQMTLYYIHIVNARVTVTQEKKTRKSTLTMTTCFSTICAYFTHTHISAHLVGCYLCLKTRNEFPLPPPSTRPSFSTRYTGVTLFDNTVAGFHPVTSVIRLLSTQYV